MIKILDKIWKKEVGNIGRVGLHKIRWVSITLPTMCIFQTIFWSIYPGVHSSHFLIPRRYSISWIKNGKLYYLNKIYGITMLYLIKRVVLIRSNTKFTGSQRIPQTIHFQVIFPNFVTGNMNCQDPGSTLQKHLDPQTDIPLGGYTIKNNNRRSVLSF